MNFAEPIQPDALPRYWIAGHVMTGAGTNGDAALQAVLVRAYARGERPLCLCIPGGIAMYIAKHEHYLIKRMPDTGPQHHPSCPSYEPELNTSGLGELLGEAIFELEGGDVEIRTDFALTRRTGQVMASR